MVQALGQTTTYAYLCILTYKLSARTMQCIVLAADALCLTYGYAIFYSAMARTDRNIVLAAQSIMAFQHFGV